MKISFLLFAATVVAAAAANNNSPRNDIHVLMYETDESLEHDPLSPLSFFKERSRFADLPTTVYGGGLSYEGFGDKYQTLRSILDVIDPNKLVVVADARDVALNVPENEDAATKAIDRFVETYKKLTNDDPGAVVMSAEGQCCVSAMTHAHPSEYFDPITKKRTKRACSSGKEGCYWNQNDNIYAWVDFHRQRAFDKTGIPRNVDPVGDVYLNAGLMAGYPADLMNLLDVLDIDPTEDDQAVLSGLMYQFPDMIVLDYGQEMFGNNQWPRGLIDGCIYEKEEENKDPKQSFLVHTETGAEPLLIHTPGKFYGCLDVLIEELGGTSQQRYLHESPQGNPRVLKREGIKFNDGRKLIESFDVAPDDVAMCGCDCNLPPPHHISDGPVDKVEEKNESSAEDEEKDEKDEKDDNNNDEPKENDVSAENEDKGNESTEEIEADVPEGRLRRRRRRLGVRGSERRHLLGAMKLKEKKVIPTPTTTDKMGTVKEMTEKMKKGKVEEEEDEQDKKDERPDPELPESKDDEDKEDKGRTMDKEESNAKGDEKSEKEPKTTDDKDKMDKVTDDPTVDPVELPDPGPGAEMDDETVLLDEAELQSGTATNYGYGSYGSYGVATNYGDGSYGSYGVATNYGDGSYGSYGVATNYGDGSYGSYGSYGVATNYGDGSYGSYGVATNYGDVSYGQYNQYGSLTTGRSDNGCADVCASHCSIADGSIAGGSYGSYGSYGAASTPDNYGQHGDASNYGYGVASNYAPGNYGQDGSYGQYGDASTPENYGSYGQYGDASTPENYGPYGQYGDASSTTENYGSYGQYGDASSTPENYGSYGSYGSYGQYGNYGSIRRRRTSDRGA